MTADFMRLQLDLVFLDHGVGEQLLAHLLEARPRLGFLALGQFEIDDLALAHFADCGEAEPVQRMADGLALRVEHAILQGDENARFHGPSLAQFARHVCATLRRMCWIPASAAMTCGTHHLTSTGPLFSPCTDSGMIPRRRATSE